MFVAAAAAGPAEAAVFAAELQAVAAPRQQPLQQARACSARRWGHSPPLQAWGHLCRRPGIEKIIEQRQPKQCWLVHSQAQCTAVAQHAPSSRFRHAGHASYNQTATAWSTKESGDDTKKGIPYLCASLMCWLRACIDTNLRLQS